MIGKEAAMKRQPSLTERETRLLDHALKGKPAWAIAELEGLTIPQVRRQLRSVLRKVDRGSCPKSAEILPFDRNGRDS